MVSNKVDGNSVIEAKLTIISTDPSKFTWNQLMDVAGHKGLPQVVKLKSRFCCPITGSVFKKHSRFNVDIHGSLWLKNHPGKFKWEPAIKSIDFGKPIDGATWEIEV